jgi:hypothetical protein
VSYRPDVGWGCFSANVITDNDWSCAIEILPVVLFAIHYCRYIAMFCNESVDLVEISLAFHNHGASHGGDNQVAGLLRLRELLC